MLMPPPPPYPPTQMSGFEILTPPHRAFSAHFPAFTFTPYLIRSHDKTQLDNAQFITFFTDF